MREGSHHPGALKFLLKCFYTNSHTFQGAAKIFEKKTFFRYTLLHSKKLGHFLKNNDLLFLHFYKLWAFRRGPR